MTHDAYLRGGRTIGECTDRQMDGRETETKTDIEKTHITAERQTDKRTHRHTDKEIDSAIETQTKETATQRDKKHCLRALPCRQDKRRHLSAMS
jgi:hypothetical protein